MIKLNRQEGLHFAIKPLKTVKISKKTVKCSNRDPKNIRPIFPFFKELSVNLQQKCDYVKLKIHVIKHAFSCNVTECLSYHSLTRYDVVRAIDVI